MRWAKTPQRPQKIILSNVIPVFQVGTKDKCSDGHVLIVLL